MSGFDWWEKKGSKKVLSFHNGGAKARGRGKTATEPYLSYNLPDILNPLRLSLPSDEELPITRKAPTPEDIESWLGKLSADAYRTLGPELQGLLRGVNLHHVLAKRHLKILILLQPTLIAVIKHLRSKYRTYPLPLEKKLSSYADLSQALLKEMAIGYKLVINDVICDFAEKSLDENMFLFAFQQSIVHLGQQLLESYIQYQPEQDGVWGELHRLYQFAERNGISTKPITPPDPQAGNIGTIQQAYMRIVLLALTQPNHLLSGQAEMIYNHLEQWIESVQMSERLGAQVSVGDMLVDLVSEQPPMIVTSFYRGQPLEGRYLDISGLKKRLEEMRNNMMTSSNAQTLPLIDRIQRDMLSRLCEAWEGRGERRSERIVDGKTPVLTSIGLDAAHHYISGEKPFAPHDEELRGRIARKKQLTDRDELASRQQTITVEEITPDAASPFNNFISGNDAWHTILGTPLPARPQAGHKTAEYPIEAWRRINHSHGGLALQRQPNNRGLMYVGSLVAFRDDRRNEAWRIGVIRWLQNNFPHDLKIGVETLANDSRAVALRILDSEQGADGYFRALIIKPLLTDGVDEALVLPANVFELHKPLLLNEGGDSRRIQLQQIITTTSSFSVFSFEQED
jgi:hypothetical protein